ncbi:MAG: energy-coupling factor transporter transmembrane protein EcfT [bacterium]|nr:energy-coupling factor transporter transmembrane protein EcfT [bacterium]
MKHDFIDKYSSLNSVLHRLDPRVKLLLSFCFLILIAATYNIKLFGLYLGIVALLLVVSKVPFHFYFKKLVLVTPLAVILSMFIFLSHLVENNVEVSLEVFSRYSPVLITIALLVSKIYLSILVLTLMVSCTRFDELLWGLRKYRLPLIVTTLSKLVYTYTFVFIDELHRTLRAYRSRTPQLRISRVKVYGNIAAGIFLRSMDRSDIIYKAMVSRGFTGEFPEGNANRLKLGDLIAVLFFLLIVIAAGLLWKI